MTVKQESIEQPGSGRAVFYLILTTFLWGGSFVFNKIGIRDLPPVVFMTLRFSLATAAMGMIAGRRLMALDFDLVRRGVLVGLALAGANLTFVFGVAGTTISRAGFLNNLFVLFIPLLAYILWRQRIERPALIGVIVATVGLFLLANGGTGGGFNRGDFFSTVCALFISLHILAVSRLLRGGDVLVVTFVQFATAAAVGGCAVLVLPHGVSHFTPSALFALGYCVVFPTVICFTLQNTYQRFVTPTQAGLIYTLDPIWVLIGGIGILGERLEPNEWLGCALIFAAVALPLFARMAQERMRKRG